MNNAVNSLVEILDIETLELNLFRGRSPQDGWQRVFGGQVIGQALMAATRTVKDRFAHSLYGYFIRPGDPSVPIIYEVDPARDGRSFATRRVVAIQHGRPIFTMSASFQIDEEGFDHQMDLTDVPQPEDLPSEAELKAKIIDQMPDHIRKFWQRQRPIELRPVAPRDYLNPAKLPPRQDIWIRTTSEAPQDRALNQCILAYASDLTLIDTSLLPHGRSYLDRKVQTASLDHSIWFHRKFTLDDWVLYSQDSPSSSGARGFSRGSIYDRSGRLIASTAQEGLIRLRP